jgi:hypothetical protein
MGSRTNGLDRDLDRRLWRGAAWRRHRNLVSFLWRGAAGFDHRHESLDDWLWQFAARRRDRGLDCAQRHGGGDCNVDWRRWGHAAMMTEDTQRDILNVLLELRDRLKRLEEVMAKIAAGLGVEHE